MGSRTLLDPTLPLYNTVRDGEGVSVALEVKGITKRYGATTALSDVSFTVESGSVHAIIGENGAGKSTLIKALCGLESPDDGTLWLDGNAFLPRSLVDARKTGVAAAFQDLSLLPNLTVAENMFMPELHTNRSGVITRRANEDAAARVLDAFDLGHIQPGDEVGELSLAEQQKLEITRAINHKPRVLLLDEPTAALPDPEWLFDILQRIRTKTMTVLYISHRLNEIKKLCGRATVLRNGRVIDTVALADVDDAEVFALMAGGVQEMSQKRSCGVREPNSVALETVGLAGGAVHDVSLTIETGEVVGVAGLGGQGQREVFRMLAGIEHPSAGETRLHGTPVKVTSPARALRHGVSFVPEERKTEGLLPGLRTAANISVSSLRKASRWGFIGGRRECAETITFADKVDLNRDYIKADIDSLSGGNQQKAILARSLMTRANILLMYDPSRGVDVGTKQSLYEMMRGFVDDGGAILWYSTDIGELMSVCDRIVVFYKNTIVDEFNSGDFVVERLLAAMTGQTAKGVDQEKQCIVTQ